MSNATRLRVLVTLGGPAAPAWHDALVDAIRAEPVDVIVQRADAPASCDPHVVVDLGGGFGGVDPSFGVWRYGFGDGAAFIARAASVGAASAATTARAAATAATDAEPRVAGTIARLYRTTADPARAVVLHEGWYKGASRDSPGTKSVGPRVAGWCARVLRQIAHGDVDVLRGPAVAVDGCAELSPPEQRRTAHAIVDGLRRWRRRERWTIGILTMSLQELLARGAMPEPRWVFGVPRGSYLADPFPLAADSTRVRLLAERYQYRRGRGSIVSLDVTRDGAIAGSRDWFEPSHHVAYPFVLRDGPHCVCVPDVAATGSARAYTIETSASAGVSVDARADAGTFDTLLDGFPAVDPTIVRHEGRWWLFCMHREHENQTELHLFHADDWRGPWRAHLLNPVKSDARSSRPAGALFVLDGTLHRPAQDCSRRYGGAIAVNRVIELTPTRFREETVASLHPLPSWPYPHGLHTLNAIDDLVIVDALRVEQGWDVGAGC
jgi:hypothetical protein